MINKLMVTESQLVRLLESIKEEDKNPCWDGYEMIGMKEKDGKEVPNCVPLEEEILQEAEYQGRKVTLNKPMAGDVKKSKVYVKNDKGNVVKVRVWTWRYFS